MNDRYEVIADIEELKWFFDNILIKPQFHESYAAVFCARYKKLTDEERAEVGISKKDAEFMATQTFRVRKFHNAADFAKDDGWNFDNFIKHLKRFNVDKGAYLTSGGYPLPEKCLATIFYVNPCDEIKVADEVTRKLDETKTAIVKAMMNGKTLADNLQSYQAFSNIESNVKHARAHCKGSVYWLDFDLDCPGWFKSETNPYFYAMKEELTKRYGLGNYVIIDTSGGYHILVKTCCIHTSPHEFCREMQRLYNIGIAGGCMPYLNDKGLDKFECIVNDSQIPGIPMPGTYQYDRPVRIINKEDFNKDYRWKSYQMM
jgi:hypothetical protein